MVSILSVLAAAATASVAFRKLYQHYWKHPNVVNSQYIDVCSEYDIYEKKYCFEKFNYSFAYSQTSQIKQEQAQEPLLTQVILFKYLKKDEKCLLYTDQIFSHWNSKQISHLLPNGIQPQLKKFLLINKSVFTNKHYYQMAIHLRNMNSTMQLQITCQKAIPVVLYIDISITELSDPKRDFLIFHSQPFSNCFLILSQKQKPRYGYFPFKNLSYNFTSLSQIIQQLTNNKIIQIWQTNQTNPIYKVIKSIKISQQQIISLSDSCHRNNNKRLKNILKQGNKYFKMIQIDL